MKRTISVMIVAIIICFLTSLLALSLAGCSSNPSYNDYYSQSETAIIILKDAIELLDMCLDDKITAEECSDQLDIVASKADDDISELAALDVSIASGQIDNICLLFEMEKVTLVDVQNELEDVKQQLEEHLYK